MVTVLGITVVWQPNIKVLLAVLIIALQLSRESYLGLLLSIVMLVMPLQPPNASWSMSVTELPMVTLVRPVQYAKAWTSSVVTELGISTLVKLLQPQNAPLPMVVTVLGITVFLQPAINLLFAVLMMALQLSRES